MRRTVRLMRKFARDRDRACAHRWCAPPMAIAYGMDYVPDPRH